MNASTIGIDLAKNVFQVHGVDAQAIATLVWQLGPWCAACAHTRR